MSSCTKLKSLPGRNTNVDAVEASQDLGVLVVARAVGLMELSQGVQGFDPGVLVEGGVVSSSVRGSTSYL
eukprot:7156526-Alexandrium_andersonii.AAC.1